MKNLKKRLTQNYLNPARRVFVKRIMQFKRRFFKRTIYDLGLHVGQDTEFYLKQGYRVVAVDANPAMIELATEKFRKEIEEGRLHLVNGAISETEGEIATFFVNNELPEWSSLDSEIGGRLHGATEVKVETVRLDALIQRLGAPYYLKIDIEGADLLAVSQIPRQQRPRYVSVENGEKVLLDELVELGYSNFKYVNQAEIKGTELTRGSKEGFATYHWFHFGSSGPFGKDLKGDWLSLGEAYEFAEELKLQRMELGDRFEAEVGWFDLHATRGNKLSWMLGL